MQRIRRHLADILAILLLLILTIVFYRKIALSDSILVGFDTFTYFYPIESYMAETLRQGRLPLWNPYLFTGVPFLANMQTAVFYPFNLIFLVLPIPRAYAYSIVLHVFLAGAFTFLLCRRSLGLSTLASLVGAITFMFSGFVNSLVGHINQLQASAWMPLLFLLCDRAFVQRNLRFAALAGVVIALQFTAGHAQEFYLTAFALGLFLAIRVIAESIRFLSDIPDEQGRETSVVGSRSPERLSNPLGSIILFCLALILGLGLASVQLLPSLELSGLSIRSDGLTYREAVSFSLPPWLALKTFLPVFNDEPPFSEWLAYVGVFSLMLALLAVVTTPRRITFWFALVISLIALFFAFGQYNPLYPIAYEWVPGLKMFRVPARWIYLYTFGISMLAAYGANYLGERARHPTSRVVFVRFMIIILAACTAFLYFYASTRDSLPFEFPGEATRMIWIGLTLSAIGVILLSLATKMDIRWIASTIIIVELFAASQGLDLNQTTLPEAYSSMQPSIARLLTDDDVYRVLPISDNAFDPGDMREKKEMLRSHFTEKEIYDYFVASKWKETLQPNVPLRYRISSIDGYDGGLLPLEDFIELKKLFPLREKQAPDGRLREEITAIPDAGLLGLLNIKYILMDRVRDAWVDGVYYDLALSKELDSNDSRFALDTLPSFEATSLGIVSHLHNAAEFKDNEVIAQVVVTDVQDKVHTFPLRAGVETSEGALPEGGAVEIAHKQARKAKAWKDDPTGWDYVGKIDFAKPLTIKRIEVRHEADQGTLVLRGMSLIDARTQSDVPIALSRSLELVHLGDVKIYRNKEVWPRIFAVQPEQRSANDDSTSKPQLWNTIEIDRADVQDGMGVMGQRVPSAVQIVNYEAESVTVKTNMSAKGYLVFTDSYYPGWRAFVDGKEQSILKANKLFKAVELEAGTHQVQFVYDPQTLRIGAYISVASLVLILTLIVAGSRRVTI